MQRSYNLYVICLCLTADYVRNTYYGFKMIPNPDILEISVTLEPL